MIMNIMFYVCCFTNFSYFANHHQCTIFCILYTMCQVCIIRPCSGDSNLKVMTHIFIICIVHHKICAQSSPLGVSCCVYVLADFTRAIKAHFTGREIRLLLHSDWSNPKGVTKVWPYLWAQGNDVCIIWYTLYNIMSYVLHIQGIISI